MGYNPETGMYTPDKPSTAVVPGSAQDPFYQSTGKMKEVTLPDGRKIQALDVGSTKPPPALEIGKVSAASGLTITGTERNAAKEAEARAIGYTKEYIASRGGINTQGYFNDTPITGQLTAEERKSVTKPDGTIDSNAMLAILNQKSGGTGGGAGGASGSSGVTAASSEAQRAAGSAYALLLAEFNKYGLGALVSPLQDLIKQGLSAGEFSLALQNTDAYKRRFAANTDRIAKGLTALSPAEYIGLEDQYQNIMRNYGLPASYYTKGDLGIQEGFNKLLANDVSATELEDRVMTAQSRVMNANPEIKQALRQFYPDITEGDMLAYALDPTKALTDIKRKVTAAEIGGAALGAGLKTSQTAAEGLAAYGITKGQAQQGYGAIAEFLPTGEKLSQIYQEPTYTQAQAEQEIFNLADSAAAAKKRKRLSQLETGSFSGSSGAGAGALNRDRAASNQTFGAGAY
jgi:hypothetical protein